MILLSALQFLIIVSTRGYTKDIGPKMCTTVGLIFANVLEFAKLKYL